MTALSACIEWQFTEAGAGLPERIRAAKEAGLDRVEFHLWRDKDMPGVARALEENDVSLTGFCVDPRRSIVDPAEHEEMLQAVRDTLAEARKVGSPPLIVASGFRVEGMSEEEHFDNAVSVLRRAAALAEEAGVTLVLEPLNTQLFSAMYLVSTPLALDIIEAVDSPNLKLIYDVHHSAVMGEDMKEVLSGRMHLVAHVQVAGTPGRNEPGTDDLDWGRIMADLEELGYDGPLGLEYMPTMPMDQSLAKAKDALNV
ncbi:TIM barrel protein [Croceicoccus marinus]|uniref:Hydroxypyruvate isomerase n=1 Tax=Croceicoccus marinus TaxID=450378 RepID=A0A1Z1FGW9_9SPHN|nr:TIM barrel protein [Croceicoccus marinus]ARU18054.1 hydroxypyruvate isomerase [Croceicoccus marinus]QNE07559.1 TIM barrel protein [Croceicoccus marinus]